MLRLILRGWAHLLLLTLFFPIAVPYIALKETARRRTRLPPPRDIERLL